MSQPPPPRYKIIERDGRLVTIDTWAKTGAPERTASPDRWRRTRPDGIPAWLVAAVLRVRDAEGRRLLTTSPNWDRKGPRVIVLSPRGERRVGAVLFVSCVALAVIVGLAIRDLDWMMPVVLIGVVLFSSALTAGAPLVTRFLDGLGDSDPR